MIGRETQRSTSSTAACRQIFVEEEPGVGDLNSSLSAEQGEPMIERTLVNLVPPLSGIPGVFPAKMNF